MALISSGGGLLRNISQVYGRSTNHGPGGPRHVPAKMPKAMKPLSFVKAAKGIGATAATVGKTVSHVTVPTVKAPAPVTSTAGKSDPTQDPFAFIQGLTVSTDPAAARALIDQVYAPARQEINNQIAQLQGTSAAQAKQMQDVYLAFEQYLSGMPSQIQAIYGQKGATDAASLMSGPTGNVGSQLGQFSDINNNLLSEEGKNWAAYAAAQPHIYALTAAQNIKQMLGVEQANETTLRAKLLDLSSQEASQILSYLNDAQAKDTSLQEWAFQQKTAQTNAAATAAATAANNASKNQQAYMNYLQKQYAINLNYKIAAGKLSVSQATAQTNAWYKQQLVAAKQQGLITDAQYKAGQLAISQQNANANTSRAATAAAAQKVAAAKKAAAAKKPKASTSSTVPGTPAFKAAVQQKIGKAKSDAAGFASSTKKKYGGTVSSKGVSAGVGLDTATRRQVYNDVYKAYATTFFTYYRQLGYKHPQNLVNAAIKNAVGWGPYG